MDNEPCEFDYICSSCGAGYWSNVGGSLTNCLVCGHPFYKIESPNKEVWVANAFPSGSQFVTNNNSDDPYLYVYGPEMDSIDRVDLCRRMICEELAGFLNGGLAPIWLTELERFNDETLIGCDGTKIVATGPYYNHGPFYGHVIPRTDDDAQLGRKRLIDRLLDY